MASCCLYSRTPASYCSIYEYVIVYIIPHELHKCLIVRRWETTTIIFLYELVSSNHPHGLTELNPDGKYIGEGLDQRLLCLTSSARILPPVDQVMIELLLSRSEIPMPAVLVSRTYGRKLLRGQIRNRCGAFS